MKPKRRQTKPKLLISGFPTCWNCSGRTSAPSRLCVNGRHLSSWCETSQRGTEGKPRRVCRGDTQERCHCAGMTAIHTHHQTHTFLHLSLKNNLKFQNISLVKYLLFPHNIVLRLVALNYTSTHTHTHTSLQRWRVTAVPLFTQ